MSFINKTVMEEALVRFELELYKLAIDTYVDDDQLEQIQEFVADGIAKAIEDLTKYN